MEFLSHRSSRVTLSRSIPRPRQEKKPLSSRLPSFGRLDIHKHVSRPQIQRNLPPVDRLSRSALFDFYVTDYSRSGPVLTFYFESNFVLPRSTSDREFPRLCPTLVPLYFSLYRESPPYIELVFPSIVFVLVGQSGGLFFPVRLRFFDFYFPCRFMPPITPLGTVFLLFSSRFVLFFRFGARRVRYVPGC